MNVFLADDYTDINFAKENGIVGIKGHRLVGGFRASLYNALPLSSVKVLVETMQTFAALQKTK